MQNRFGLLVSDMMPIYIIMPRYSHNYSLFYQLLDNNLFTHHNTYDILREATSEIYGPGSISYHIRFQSTFICIFYFPIYIIKIPKIFILSYYLYQISLSQVTVKGLTTPLSRWLQGSWLFVQVLGDLRVISYWIDTLVLKNWGKYLRYFAASPFPLQGKTNAVLKR